MKTLTLIPITRIIALISSCILLSFSSCKINRERQLKLDMEEKKIEQYDIQRDSYSSSVSDSSKRHWSFWTDGWLYYHPDSGLLAQGGVLHLSETKHSEQQMEQQRIYEQVQKLESQQQQIKENTSIRYNVPIGLWIAISAILAFAIIYLVYRFLL